MAVSTPDWLKQHGGEVRPSKDPRSCAVYFAGSLQYVLLAVPARGQFTCRITQTINGRRLDNGKTYAGVEEALRGGLDELREALGW